MKPKTWPAICLVMALALAACQPKDEAGGPRKPLTPAPIVAETVEPVHQEPTHPAGETQPLAAASPSPTGAPAAQPALARITLENLAQAAPAVRSDQAGLEELGNFYQMAWLADGTQLLVAAYAGIFVLDGYTLAVQSQVKPGDGWPAVAKAAFSPDLKLLATSGLDQTVRLWDPTTGQQVRQLPAKADFGGGVAFSPDGLRLAVGTAGQTIEVWDLATEKAVLTLAGHTMGVESLLFSPDGRLLASGSGDFTAKIWEAASGKELFTLPDHPYFVEVLAFSPDGGRLVSGANTAARVWDTGTGGLVFDLATQGGLQALAFSPDGRLLVAAGGGEPTIKVWDAASGQEQTVLAWQAGYGRGLLFSPQGDRLALAGNIDRFTTGVMLWEISGGEQAQVSPQATPMSTPAPASGAAFAPENAAQAARVASWKPWNWSRVEEFAWSPDSSRLALVGDGAVVEVWEPASGSILLSLHGHGGQPVNSLSFSADGRVLVSGSADKTVKTWDAATGRSLQTYPLEQAVYQAALSPQGDLLAVITGEIPPGDTLHVLEAAGGRELYARPDTTAALFIPGGGTLASATNYQVKLWEAATGKELGTFESRDMLGMVNRLALSADQTILGARSESGSIRAWKTAGLTESLSAFRSIQDLAVSADGRLLATISSLQNELVFWDLAAQEPVSNVSLPEGPRRAAFSPDGRLLAVGTYQGLQFWAVPAGSAPAAALGEAAGQQSVTGSSTTGKPGTWSLPADFAGGEQGQRGWFYYAAQGGRLVELNWDNQVVPLDSLVCPTWNPAKAAPRYLFVQGPWDAADPASCREVKANLQPGEGADLAIGWQAPRDGSLEVSGTLTALWPAAAYESWCGAVCDDGVFFSLRTSAGMVAGPVQVAHPPLSGPAKGTPSATLEAAISIRAGEFVYFYVGRGEWQDRDVVSFEFRVAYAP